MFGRLPQLLLGALLCSAFPLGGCMSFHDRAIEAPKGATFMTVNGVALHYTDEGEGPPVVLIHGFASSLGTWAAVRPALATKHRVIALDLKGFGHSARPEGDYSPAAQATLVLGLLDALEVTEPAALVAHSWGSSVALATALAAPERVSRIALYDAWVFEDQLPTTFHFARAPGIGEFLIGAFYDQRSDDKIAGAFFDERYVTEELVSNVEDQLSRPGTKAAALAAIRGQHFEAMEPRYRDIKQPVLLLWGREDRVTSLDYGERLSLELPDAKLIVYPRCGHFPMLEARRPSTRDLAAFLAEGLGAQTIPATPLAPSSTPEPDPPGPASSEAPTPAVPSAAEAIP